MHNTIIYPIAGLLIETRTVAKNKVQAIVFDRRDGDRMIKEMTFTRTAEESTVDLYSRVDKWCKLQKKYR